MDKFNETYIIFLNYLREKFPHYKKGIVIKEHPGEHYFHHFIELNLPFMEDISVKNTDVFRYGTGDRYLIRGLRFKRVIDKIDEKVVPRDVLNVIWNYLHTLYTIALKECGLSDYIKTKYPTREDLILIMDNGYQLLENINKCFDMPYEEILSDSGSDEEESEESESGESESGESLAETKTEETKKDDDVTKEEDVVEGVEKKDAKTERKKRNKKKKTGRKFMDEMGKNPFENTMIGNLAKELADTGDIDVSALGNLKNPADILGLFTGGGSDESKNAIQNIAQNVCKKLQSKIEKGEIDQVKLSEEALKMMGNMNIFGQMGMDSGMAGLFGGMMGGGGKKKQRAGKRAKKSTK